MIEAYRTTCYWMIGITTLVGLALTALSFWLEPIRGDLTRIAGLPENWYGWHSEQRIFEPPLVDEANHPDDVKKSYDVVVLGDSYSRNFDQTWQNFLINQTGWRIITFDIRKVTPDDILNSAFYQESPPAVFMYQTVERRLQQRALRLLPTNKNCAPVILPTPQPPLTLSPPGVETKKRDRIKPPTPFQFDVAAQFLKQRLQLKKNVYLEQLSTDQLFTSKRPDTLLIFYEDVEKLTAPYKDIGSPAQTRCGLLTLQNLVQANEKTLFLTMVGPDKSSVYAPYMKDAKAEKLYDTELSTILKPPLHAVELKPLLQHLIGSGAKDVYLPNDSHWGTAGYELAAIAVFDTIEQLIGHNP